MKQTAVVVDYVDIDGYRRQQTFNSERAAEMFAEAIQVALLNETPRNAIRVVKPVEDSAPPVVLRPKKAKREPKARINPAPDAEHLAPVPTVPTVPASLASDLVWGVAEIAAEIGRNSRQTFHMLEKGKLPAKKVGGRWCASRAGLRLFFANNFAG